MVTIKEDLERIVVDVQRKVVGRKAYAILGSVIAVLVIIVISLAAAAGASHNSVLREWLYGGPTRCATAACLHSAAWIADNIDQSVEPCDDFYKFSCGSWQSRRSIPPDHDELTLQSELDDEVDEKLRELIEQQKSSYSPSPLTGDRLSAEQKLRYFFKSCMHDYGRQNNAGTSVVDMIRSTLGNWYLLDPDSWQRSWNFQRAVIDVHNKLLVNVFFTTYISLDTTTASNILSLYSSGLGLSSTAYYIHDTKLPLQEAYKAYMRAVARLLLRDSNVTTTIAESERELGVEQFVNDVFSQEQQLALLLKRVRDSGQLYLSSRTTVGQINNNFTQLDWRAMINGLFDDVTLTPDTPVVLWGPAYFSLVDEMLRNESQSNTKDRMLNNYLAWRIAFKYSSELSWEYRQAGFKFLQVSTGQTEWPTTWKSCVDTVKSRLGSILATMFVKSHLTDDVRLQVNEVFVNIRGSLIKRITDLQWMDNTTQYRAIDKLNSVKCQIGFSDMYFNDSVMQQIHDSLEIDASQSYLQNVVKLNLFQRRLRLQLLHSKQESFYDHLPVLGSTLHYWTRPYYRWYTNTLYVPAGALTDPMFSTQRSKIINYALLGSTIASQLVNAVIQTGRFTWINGSSWNWWTNSTSREYIKTKECFDKYFDTLTAGPFFINGTNINVTVNGRSTTNRYVDDMAGILIGIDAYKNSQKSAGASPDRLPVGLRMTSEQLYFTAYAQSKCYMRTDTESYRYAKLNILPENLELNSLLSHSSQFINSFQCTVDSNLSTSNRCNIF